MDRSFIYAPMPEPLSVYVPLESLTESVIRSILSVVLQFNEPNFDYSERTLLIFLLAINKKLKEIENDTDTNEKKFDEQIIQHAKQVRQWLMNYENMPVDWDKLRELYETTAHEKCDDMAKYYGSKNSDPYFELTMKTRYKDVEQSRGYMAEFRKEGFKPEELKVYWNKEQLEMLIPNEGDQCEIDPPHDPSDADVIKNLRQFPVWKRDHPGEISYKHSGIEKAVFQIPENAQIIVLNFANEQSPGGGYLRHAWAQEEIILYNSDGYRALLDLKYRRMGGGYAIPEFGLAYVRDIRFVDPDSNKYRSTDMLVSACYCLNGAQLYDNPRDKIEWKKNNLAKFEAFMAAAVANTKDDGSNTYLLLGPIGTGAFGNDVIEIGEVFRDVLKSKMMHSKGSIRYAFPHIWFVSTDEWKNDAFRGILADSEPNDNNGN